MAEPQTREHRKAQTHTRRYPPTYTQVLGWGGSFLILHKAGLLRGAPRHRGPLLTKPPAGFKSDPPSRLQRGQGTRLPCPPPPPRSAPLLRSGRGPGCPQRSAGSTCACPRAASAPLLPGEPCLRGDPGSRRHSRPGRGAPQPDAAACVRSAGARPDGSQVGRAPESAARSRRPFLSRCRGPLCPDWPGPCPCRAWPIDPRQGSSATQGSLYSSDQSGFLRALQRTSSATLGPPPSTPAPHCQSCEAGNCSHP